MAISQSYLTHIGGVYCQSGDNEYAPTFYISPISSLERTNGFDPKPFIMYMFSYISFFLSLIIFSTSFFELFLSTFSSYAYHMRIVDENTACYPLKVGHNLDGYQNR
jgi:hypothetical protein